MSLNAKIFVMIPAYRDPSLIDTLRSLFNDAKNSKRVFVAIGAQYDEAIPMPDLSEFPAENIRLVTIHPENRPGVFRLRHILNKLYANEEYYLSIDSHTRVIKDWDEILINMLEDQPNFKTIIADSEGTGHENEYSLLHMRVQEIELYGPRLVMQQSETLMPTINGKFEKIVYLQAGMFFTRGQFAREIRWGQFWHNDQEEPFLSYEAFMMGWNTVAIHGKRVIHHEPTRYYDAVYESEPNSENRHFRDKYNEQRDSLQDICPRIWQALLYNTGPYAIAYPVREAKEWWLDIGLAHVYEKYTNQSGHVS
jgi:hypothetical protein